MKTAEQSGPAPSNAFLQVMQTHDGGEVCNELADAQRACIEAVALTGKAATISLTVKYVPAAKGAFAVAFSEPKLKLPAKERAGSLWFGDENGQLSRQDPRQRELPLKTLPAVQVPDPQQAPSRAVEDPLKREARAVS